MPVVKASDALFLVSVAAIVLGVPGNDDADAIIRGLAIVGLYAIRRLAPPRRRSAPARPGPRVDAESMILPFRRGNVPSPKHVATVMWRCACERRG